MMEEKKTWRTNTCKEKAKDYKLEEKAYEMLTNLTDKRVVRWKEKTHRLEDVRDMTCLEMIMNGHISIKELFGNNILYHAFTV